MYITFESFSIAFTLQANLHVISHRSLLVLKNLDNGLDAYQYRVHLPYSHTAQNSKLWQIDASSFANIFTLGF